MGELGSKFLLVNYKMWVSKNDCADFLMLRNNTPTHPGVFTY